MDDQVEMRMKSKKLVDCTLPEGFRLVTPQPRQYWMEQQLRWAFEIAYGDYKHVARYIQQVSDEIQMEWAMADFTAELMFAGVRLGEKKSPARLRAELVLQ
jgi:hypothetical protein